LTHIKICGITNLDDARCVAEAGAELMGFILYPKSPRFVPPEDIATIVRSIRDEFGPRAPRCVGVFVNEPPARVREILERTGLDLAQMHGDEPPAEVRRLHPCAFKAFRPATREQIKAQVATYAQEVLDAADLPQFLVDAYHAQHFGGTGVLANLDAARWVAQRYRLLLAGGLTPQNVAQAIAQVHPWGVDVSSGVERTKGRKDHDQVRAFVQAVRRAYQA
jgi:phosphoribosylanthranilate isomerase